MPPTDDHVTVADIKVVQETLVTLVSRAEVPNVEPVVNPLALPILRIAVTGNDP